MENNIFDNRYICDDSEYFNARLALKKIEAHVLAGEKVFGIDAYYEKDRKIGYIYGNEVLTEPIYDKTYAPLSVDASNALRVSFNDHPILLDAYKTEEVTMPLTTPITGEVVFYTNYNETIGYDIQDFVAKPIVQKDLSQEGAISLLQLIHRNTIWLQYTDDCYKLITGIGYLDVYPYFKRGITRYDYWHEDICDVIYINAYGDVLQIANNCYEEAWMLWNMEW